MTAFAALLGTRLIQTRPYDPESKGLVERANDYLETSFSARPEVHLCGGFQRAVVGVVGRHRQPPRPCQHRPSRAAFTFARACASDSILGPVSTIQYSADFFSAQYSADVARSDGVFSQYGK